jgi:hypothetical protein
MFLLILTAVGLAAALAFGVDAARFEAENMKESSTKVTPVLDKTTSSATGAMRYTGNGTATQNATFAAEATRLEVRVRGVQDRYWPQMQVLVDGRVVGSVTVSDPAYAVWSVDVSIPAGSHKVEVKMYNDTARAEKLFVDNVAFTYEPPPPLPSDCTNTISAGQDLDAALDASDDGGARDVYCVEAGTYNVDRTLMLFDNDELVGEAGATRQRGPATDPDPVVMIRNGADLETLITMRGASKLRWVDVAGAKGGYAPNWQPGDPCDNAVTADGQRCPLPGTGNNVAMGQASGDARVEFVRSADSEAVGISNAKGVIADSEFSNNNTNDDFEGITGAAVKGVTEFEAARNYVHDNGGNGLWCDHGCEDDPLRGANGAWFHDNLVVSNETWGIRYEFSPLVAEGVHSAQPTFLAEGNAVHGNGVGGGSNRDAQNGTWRGNAFGSATVAGVSYPNNRWPKMPGNAPVALAVSDSGRSDRTDLWNADVYGNALDGERVNGCDLPDDIVDCRENTR